MPRSPNRRPAGYLLGSGDRHVTGRGLDGRSRPVGVFPPTPSGGGSPGRGTNPVRRTGLPGVELVPGRVLLSRPGHPAGHAAFAGPAGPEASTLSTTSASPSPPSLNPAAVDGVVTRCCGRGWRSPTGPVHLLRRHPGVRRGGPGQRHLRRGLRPHRVLLLRRGGIPRSVHQITSTSRSPSSPLTVPSLAIGARSTGRRALRRPDRVTLLKTYDMETEESTKGMFISSDGTLGPFTPDPQGPLVPKVARRSPGGGSNGCPAPRSAVADMAALPVDFVDLPAGHRLRSELTISDYGATAPPPSCPGDAS